MAMSWPYDDFMRHSVALVLGLVEANSNDLVQRQIIRPFSILWVLVQSPKSQLAPARFLKHNIVVALGRLSEDAKCSDRRKPSNTPKSSANIIVAPLTVRCSLLDIMCWIFLHTSLGKTADLS